MCSNQKPPITQILVTIPYNIFRKYHTLPCVQYWSTYTLVRWLWLVRTWNNSFKLEENFISKDWRIWLAFIFSNENIKILTISNMILEVAFFIIFALPASYWLFSRKWTIVLWSTTLLRIHQVCSHKMKKMMFVSLRLQTTRTKLKSFRCTPTDLCKKFIDCSYIVISSIKCVCEKII